MNFPKAVSFTITNRCNLRCQMCGQWSKEGYMHGKSDHAQSEMSVEDWKKLVDEAAEHGVKTILLRGGETFLYPNIIELMEYINSKGIFISIDTNGTMIGKFAHDIARLGNIHLTISVDGPKEIHDYVRGVKGCFDKIKENLDILERCEKESGNKISRSICFTISRYSYKGLGQMPDIARELNLGSVTIVPYYYFPEDVGKRYEEELRENFDCEGYSWLGFHHEESGVDFDVFKEELRKYESSLGDIYDYPYMRLDDNGYKVWFEDSTTAVTPDTCENVEKLIDIQANGDANFCVDFPDYIIGNVRESTIEEIWNGAKAEKFRQYRRNRPLAVCRRCGAKYMARSLS